MKTSIKEYLQEYLIKPINDLAAALERKGLRISVTCQNHL